MTRSSDVNSRTSLAWAYAQAWVGKGASALIYMALGYLLQPAEFGSFAVASTFVVLSEMFVEQTMAQAVIQLPDPTPQQLGSLRFIALLLGSLCALGSVVMSLFFFQTTQATDVSIAWYALELAACPILIAMNAIPIGLYRRAMDYKTLARRTAVATIAGGVAGIVVGVLQGGGHALVALSLTYQIVSYWILRHRGNDILLNPSWRDARAFYTLMLVNGQPKAADFLESKGLELVVAQCMGLPAAGALSYASRVAQTLFTFLASPSLDAAWGEFGRRRQDQGQLLGTYQRYQALLSTTTLGLFFALALSSYQMIPAVLGSKWSVLHGLMPFLCLALIIRTKLYLATILIQVTEPNVSVSTAAMVRAILCLVFTMTGGLFFRDASVAGIAYALAGLAIVPPTGKHLAELSKRAATSLLIGTAGAMLVFGLGWAAYQALRHALHQPISSVLDGAIIAALSGAMLAAAAFRHRALLRGVQPP